MSGITERLYEALKKAQLGCGHCGCPECYADELYAKGKHEDGCSIGEALAEWEENEAHWDLFWAALTGKVEKKI